MRAAYDILGAHTAKFHCTQHASFPERDGSVQQRATRFVIRVYAAPYWCACFRLFSGATNTILYCIQAVTPGVEAMLYAFHLQVTKLKSRRWSRQCVSLCLIRVCRCQTRWMASTEALLLGCSDRMDSEPEHRTAATHTV
jgi:hypothetical protein